MMMAVSLFTSLLIFYLSSDLFVHGANVQNSKYNIAPQEPPTTSPRPILTPRQPPDCSKHESGDGSYSEKNCSDYHEIEIKRSELSELERWKTQMVIACTIIAAVEIFIVVIIILYWKQIRWSLRKIQCPCEESSRRQRRERRERRLRQQTEQRRLRHLLITSTQHAIQVTSQQQPSSQPQASASQHSVSPYLQQVPMTSAISGEGGAELQRQHCALSRHSLGKHSKKCSHGALNLPAQKSTTMHCKQCQMLSSSMTSCSIQTSDSKSSPTKHNIHTSKAPDQNVKVISKPYKSKLGYPESEIEPLYKDLDAKCPESNEVLEPVPSTSYAHASNANDNRWQGVRGRGFYPHHVAMSDSESDCEDICTALATVQVHR